MFVVVDAANNSRSIVVAGLAVVEDEDTPSVAVPPALQDTGFVRARVLPQ